MFFDAPHELRGEFGPAGREQALDELDALGVDVVRLIVYWVEVAPSPNSSAPPEGFDPSDPGTYGPGGSNWSMIDAVVQGAAARGMSVSLVPAGKFPSGVVPRWASADPNGTRSDPKPGTFEDFMTALGTRYGGYYRPDREGPRLPRVSFVSAWNEPNSELFLGPRKKRGKLYLPTLYRRLVFEARRGLSRAGWDGTFLIGETAPRRSSHAIAPLDLLRGSMCLTPAYRKSAGCGRLPGDGWAHHPYARNLAPQQVPKDKTRITIANLGVLIRALNRAGAAGAVSPLLPVWITEYGSEETGRHSDLDQAVNIATAERLATRFGRVRSIGQYLLRDDPNQPWATRSGLRTNDSPFGGCSGCKPALDAFRTPLSVRAIGKRTCIRRRTVVRKTKSGKRVKRRRCVRRGSPRRVSIWSHIRPANSATTVTVWARDGKRKPRRLISARTNGAGYVQFTSRNKRLRTWRVTWNGHQGPWVPAIRF